MFHSQPFISRFGTVFEHELAKKNWNSVSIAVAWLRQSGIKHLYSPLKDFLTRGNELRVIVGVDLENTTEEGLKTLLDLQAHGNLKSYVFHNEAGPIFHPKVYLLKDADKAKLYVGSNNITEYGLFINHEAFIEFEEELDHPTIVSASDAFDSWMDSSSDLVKELTPPLLKSLVDEGYVVKESAIKKSFKKKRTSKKKSGKRTKLFGSRSVTAPVIPGKGKSTSGKSAKGKKTSKKKASTKAAVPSPTGKVLLMRVRKAHATDRPTQTQIPKRVANTPFFGGIMSVTSVHNGETHKVTLASARGIINTLKLEVPEMRQMNDPVMRFERTSKGIQYEAYDSSSVKGRLIMNSLDAGRVSTPQTTVLTVPSKPANSTWWRFI